MIDPIYSSLCANMHSKVVKKKIYLLHIIKKIFIKFLYIVYMTDKKWKFLYLFIYTYDWLKCVYTETIHALSNVTIVKWKDIITDINEFFMKRAYLNS